MSDYPERRPYATTVPHSGYRAKPLVPQPPSDALTILRSHIGYDDLRKGTESERERMDSGSAATSIGRAASSRPYRPSPPSTQRLLPTTERTSQEALTGAELQHPIEHDAHTYHGCQQAVLNAELREKVESKNADWSTRIAAIQELLADLPSESVISNSRIVDSLRTYVEAYRCTEDLTVSEVQLMQQQQQQQKPLRTPLSEIGTVSHLPVVPMDVMRRTLDDLLRSPYLLAPLENYVAQLRLLDRLSALTWANESAAVTASAPAQRGNSAGARKARADTGEVGDAEGDTELRPSRAAAALHERLHYNPGDYAERELKRSEEALAELQRRVLTAKRLKEAAIDAEDPLTALRSLHAQVDFSNDLLLLYKARMKLVGMHAEDVQSFRQDVVSLIDDSRRAAEAVQTYAHVALPNVQHDMVAVSDAMESVKERVGLMRAAEVIADRQMRERLSAIDADSRGLWQQVHEVLQRIAEKAQERTRFSQQCMSLREQRAKEVAAAGALLKAQETHQERLRHCEEVLTQWEQVGSVYGKYVEACAPKLLQHLSAVEDADEDLSQREAEEYVGFYEQFVYAAEEARAKRRTQADRMRLLQRSTQLHHERAVETLDPDAAAHAQRMADTTQELEEVQLYLQYVTAMEEERRAEVDPVLKRVLVRHTQAQLLADAAAAASDDPSQLPTAGLLDNGSAFERAAAAAAAAARKATPSPTPAAAAAADSTVAAAAAPTEDGAVVPAVAADSPDAMMTTVAHPFVTARQIGLAHEDAYVAKHEQLAAREWKEVEAKQTGLRHSREELQAMQAKYRNADDIRALLGID